MRIPSHYRVIFTYINDIKIKWKKFIKFIQIIKFIFHKYAFLMTMLILTTFNKYQFSSTAQRTEKGKFII